MVIIDKLTINSKSHFLLRIFNIYAKNAQRIKKGCVTLKKLFLLILSLMLVITFGSKSFALSKKSYIIAGTTDKITSLDPAKAYEYFSDNILQNIMGGLVKYIPGTTKIVPDMAKSWKISKDGTVYTFKLKKKS